MKVFIYLIKSKELRYSQTVG